MSKITNIAGTAAEHIRVTKTDKLKCFHCGGTEPLPAPLTLTEYERASRSFTNVHRICKPSKN
ncbi:MAG: hypothetical protein JSS76_08325 [Bacteroidetes bacterium]|nr:hypothetical protein [Bacteroidota bacterium]